MQKPTKITIHIETVHECGQVQEQIVSLDIDHEFTMTQSIDTLPGLEGGISVDSKFWIPPTFARATFGIEGHYSKVDVTGIEHKDHRLLCAKCGANVLFPESEP